MVIIELTVCYELSFQGARQRKEAKYLDLVEDVERCAELIPVLQVGSRGFVDIDSFQLLQNYVSASKRRSRQIFTDIATAAIKGSYKIWASRNHPFPLSLFACLPFMFFHLWTLFSCIICFLLYTFLFISHLYLVYLILCMLYPVLQDVNNNLFSFLLLKCLFLVL